MQRQLKSSFIKTSFESKTVKNITFHCLQQLVDTYKFVYIYVNLNIYIYIYIYIYKPYLWLRYIDDIFFFESMEKKN